MSAAGENIHKPFQIHRDGAPGSHAPNGKHGGNGRGHTAGSPGVKGQDAGQPTSGQDGGNIHMFLSAVDDGTISLQTEAADAEIIRDHRFLPLDTMIHASVVGGAGGNGGVGGNGGNGAQGSKGRNATRFTSGGNGGPGGQGGDAGHGSSGATGGRGGSIDVHVADIDSYLLMAVYHADCPADRVHGGCGGRKGRAGQPGKGGEGGRGGSSHRWTDSDGNSHYKSGGSRGPDGANGRPSHVQLTNGANGQDGNFAIHITDHPKQCFSSRYDLRLGKFALDSEERLDKMNFTFQYSDTIHINTIDVENMGGMLSPAQESEVRVVPTHRIVPVLEHVAFVEQRIESKRSGPAHGMLSFRVKVPDIRAMGDDMDAFRCNDRLHLVCAQLGPQGFTRRYTNFDLQGKLLNFRFPVENERGFEGLSTIRAGDGMRVSLSLCNKSLSNLGINSSSRRQLFVQFYRNPKTEFDMASHNVDLQMEDTECNTCLDDNTDPSVWRGTRLPIEFLASGDTIELKGTLRLSSQVSPYSRLAIQAELVLQDLPADMDDPSAEPVFSPIQRRQLVVSTEPSYVPSDNNHVVLVTSSATTKQQFVSWNTLFIDKLGLRVGHYSVSIYGSLSPDFELANGCTLAQVFANKLVVILDDNFNPLDESVSSMCPSCMLPNGCQSQSSGFDASTTFLLVGSSKDAINQALISHYTAPPTDAGSFASVRDFYQYVEKRLRKEQEHGCVLDETIGEDVIRVESPDLKRLERTAHNIKRYLKKCDRLRQYIVAPQEGLEKDAEGGSYRTIVVRRGYCRASNSASVFNGKSKLANGDSSAILATIQSLPYDSLIIVFGKAISREDEELVGACLDTFTQALLWDLSNFLDGRFQVTENMKNAFPSLSKLTSSDKMNMLVAQGETSERSRTALSKLLARFECVANARDLSPWWWPWSRKHAVRQALLMEMVASLKEHWSTAVIASVLETETEQLEAQVRAYLHKQYSCGAAPRRHGRWRKALLYVCSHRNQDKKYRAASGTYRLIEMETDEHTQKSRAIRPRKTVAKANACRDMQQQAKQQQKMSHQLLASIQQTRARNEIRGEDDIEVAL